MAARKNINTSDSTVQFERCMLSEEVTCRCMVIRASRTGRGKRPADDSIGIAQPIMSPLIPDSRYPARHAVQAWLLRVTGKNGGGKAGVV